EHFKKSRAIAIGPALIDIMMSGAAESSDFFLQELYRSAGRKAQYIRVEPRNLHSIQEELDAASPSNIQKLVALGDRMVSENDDLLNKLVERLVKEKHDSHTKSPWWFLSTKE